MIFDNGNNVKHSENGYQYNEYRASYNDIMMFFF